MIKDTNNQSVNRSIEKQNGVNKKNRMNGWKVTWRMQLCTTVRFLFKPSKKRLNERKQASKQLSSVRLFCASECSFFVYRKNNVSNTTSSNLPSQS